MISVCTPTFAHRPNSCGSSLLTCASDSASLNRALARPYLSSWLLLIASTGTSRQVQCFIANWSLLALQPCSSYLDLLSPAVWQDLQHRHAETQLRTLMWIVAHSIVSDSMAHFIGSSHVDFVGIDDLWKDAHDFFRHDLTKLIACEERILFAVILVGHAPIHRR